MSKINNYLPKVLQEILELKLINENLDIELTLLDKSITNVEKESVVQTATDYGISHWEKSLGIIPSDSDSLEVRRFRINNILTSKLPYTIRWLRQKLTEIVGSESGWTLNMNYTDYTITIVLSGLDTDLMLEVEKQLRNAIPANMVLEIGGPSIASARINTGAGLSYATKYKIDNNFGLIPFEWNLERFYNGSIDENGNIDTSMEGEAICSVVQAVYPNRYYIFGNNQDYLLYGYALYDIYGNVLDRQMEINIDRVFIPENVNLIRLEVRDGNGIVKEDITGAYFVQE